MVDPKASAVQAEIEAWGDLQSHRSAWLSALQIAHDSAKPATEDEDDKSYWQHEIDVFNRTFDALANASLTTRTITGRIGSLTGYTVAPDTGAELEGYLKQQLAKIYEEAKARAAPIMAKLVQLECLKPPKPLIYDAKLAFDKMELNALYPHTVEPFSRFYDPSLTEAITKGGFKPK